MTLLQTTVKRMTLLQTTVKIYDTVVHHCFESNFRIQMVCALKYEEIKNVKLSDI